MSLLVTGITQSESSAVVNAKKLQHSTSHESRVTSLRKIPTVSGQPRDVPSDDQQSLSGMPSGSRQEHHHSQGLSPSNVPSLSSKPSALPFSKPSASSEPSENPSSKPSLSLMPSREPSTSPTLSFEPTVATSSSPTQHRPLFQWVCPTCQRQYQVKWRRVNRLCPECQV